MAYTDFRNVYLNRIESLEATLNKMIEEDTLYNCYIFISFKKQPLKAERVLTDGNGSYAIFQSVKEAKARVAELPQNKLVKYTIDYCKMLLMKEWELLYKEMETDKDFNLQANTFLNLLLEEKDYTNLNDLYDNKWWNQDKSKYIDFLENINYCFNRMDALFEKIKEA